MTDKSIIFSAESVRAILEGRKTQHRMVVKYQFPGAETVEFGMYHPIGIDKHGIAYPKELQFGAWSDNADIKCPFEIGQKLWVRETWGIGCRPHPYSGWVDGIEYKADELFIDDDKVSLPLNVIDDRDLEKYESDGWKSPVHMPRWASRLSLEVTDIRCERLQDINEEDAVAEGITDGGCLNCGCHEPCGCDNPQPDRRDAYTWLWDTTNAKRGYPWDSNPWAWVIDFKEVSV